ncbi:MAG TPA: DUF1499 domain-containing protein [Burkholderiales bacterium]|nr:DUF1499 domain-containing protein [Burkholderiales bacterium]
MSEQMQSTSSASVAGRVAAIGLLVAALSALAMVLSGVGYRLELWHFRTGFQIIRWAFWAAVAGGVLSLLGLILPQGRTRQSVVVGAIGFVIAVVTGYVPWNWYQTLQSLPYIHDITTDTDNPPAFVAVKKLRKADDHPVEYDGAEVAAQQKKAYPDLAPLTVKAAPAQVFDRAKAVIEQMGLTVVDANSAEGRIEATYTSLLYGFKDDVVVRIAATADGGARVDVRSKSRVGRSDLGQNAHRIRTFLAKLRTALG